MLQPLQYVESRALSQSDLKIFRKSLLRFLREIVQGDRLDGISSRATDIGDIVDCLITNPEGMKDYKIVEEVQCSDAIKAIVTDAWLKIQVAHPELNAAGYGSFIEDEDKVDPFFVQAGRDAEYQKKYGDEALARTIRKDGYNYFKSLVESGDTKIVDKNLYDLAVKTKDKALNDPKVGPLLNMKTDKKWFIEKQVSRFGKFSKTEQKILPDIVIGNSETKLLYPYDCKTCHDRAQFLINYYKHGYGYQGSYYDNVLMQNFPGYKVQPFRFIAIPVNTDEAPLIYRMTREELDLYAKGGYSKRGQRIIGWIESIMDIEWHLDQNRWDYPRAYVDKGEIVIDSVYMEQDSDKDPL